MSDNDNVVDFTLSDEEEEKRTKEQTVAIEKAMQILRPHFDTGQLLLSFYDAHDSTTRSRAWGWGNWNARIGHAQAWIHSEIETNTKEQQER